jgi:hypothetical protein
MQTKLFSKNKHQVQIPMVGKTAIDLVSDLMKLPGQARINVVRNLPGPQALLAEWESEEELKG